jgi:hypothetical protein
MKNVSLAVAILALTLVAATGATSAPSTATPRAFSLLEVTGKAHGLNGFHFQRAPRAGDQIAQTDALYEWADGKRGARAGRAEMITTTTSNAGPHGFVALLIAQAFVPGGSLFVEGYADFGPSDAPKSFPILGGTGSYATARGYVTARPLGQDSTKLDFHLAP